MRGSLCLECRCSYVVCVKMKAMTYWKRLQHTPLYTWPLLLILVIMVLLPYGWLAEQWSLFHTVIDFLFSTEFAHTIGHLTIFMVLGTAVLRVFPRLQQQPRLYLALIVALGVAQEILQLVTFKHHAVSLDEGYDLLIDIIGAGIALSIIRRWQHPSS